MSFIICHKKAKKLNQTLIFNLNIDIISNSLNKTFFKKQVCFPDIPPWVENDPIHPSKVETDCLQFPTRTPTIIRLVTYNTGGIHNKNET